ncbi:hypothetical protein [Endothiovibrio diazotrophicus]
MPKPDLFADTEHARPPRKKPRVMAHVSVAAIDVIEFECLQCGWSSGWLEFDMTITEAKRGIPCPNCNPQSTPQE